MSADDWTGTRQSFADSANWFVRAVLVVFIGLRLRW